MKTKERVNLLASDVRRSQSEAASAIKEMLILLLGEVKDNLVSSTGDETLRLQGEAQVLMRLHKMVTVEPPKIQRSERGNQ